MRFGVLGPLAVWTADGGLVPVPGLKVRALLADLLVHEGRPVPADRLIDDLWGEALPGNPMGSLSAKVSQLRRVLEDAEPGARALVESRPAGYLLGADDERVDARRFQRLLTEARRTADAEARAGLLAEALGLWRGPAFADFADEPFTRAAIAWLEELRLTALEEHAEVRLALGEHGAVAGELGDAVAAHPLRERLRAAHMRALYRTGRQNEALESYERLRVLLADELGLDPGSELAALHRAILTQDPCLDGPAAPAVRPSGPRSNLPVPSTALIGRDGAVAEIRARLGTDRLVTLTGPGGVGKTRLAVETAAGLVDRFADGVWMAELAAFERSTVPDLAEVVTAILDIRDGPGGPATPLDRLAAALGARRLLLVLDNCEHVVEQAAELAERLLRRVPGVRILATSREPLGLAGEVVWAVPPLEVPDGAAGQDLGTVAEASAVRLFAARAEAASRGFRLDEGTARAVAVLCRRLDGIPLALELAATRVRTLGVEGLVARLDDRFRLLATGHRGAPPRQRTLTAMIDWSWDLLSGPERAVLRRLAVHADGCTVEGAEAVCAGGDVPGEEVPEEEVLDLLVRLVDRSLVVMTEDQGESAEGPGEGPRYRLLESVAAYSADRLRQAGEDGRTRDLHARHHLALAERGERRLYGPEQARWLRIFDVESANLRAALDTAVAARDADGALRLVDALAWYWFLRGRLTEALRSLDAALALDGGPPVPRARAVTWRTGLAMLKGTALDWAARRDEALRLVDAAGDPGVRAWARWFLTFAGSEVDDVAAAAVVLEEALAAFRASGDRWGEGAALAMRAMHGHAHGDPAALERDAERAAALFAEIGDRWGRLQAIEWLGAHAELTADYDRAERLQRDGQRMAEELHLWPDVAGRMAWRGWIAHLRGDQAPARQMFGRALRVAADQGLAQVVTFAELGLGLVALREGRLDDAEERLGRMLDAVPRGEFPPLYLPLIQVGLGYAAEQRGDAAAALRLQRDALAVALRLEAPRDMVFSLEGLAGALSLSGRHEEAAAPLGKAAAIREETGLKAGPAEQGDIDRTTARIRGAMGAEPFAAFCAAGALLDPEEILRRAEKADPAGVSVWAAVAPDQPEGGA
ncbi:BTAD domain-containing putative transcriptional regulator [Actinomadura rubrisoli]|uniref:AfsR/SARP family transcriptional regulator n=1 Tax=Actinomadura rubrisoli TaxID=2530368 RepID=A0A4R5B897_9ACTN|nr:BTAD domain-containing putative transcriptional regulator [Actinomadura rubrisoli]TDD80706.1 AfsR/SARP family transcriptional regulator [Actinomadura rubrisoli]